MAKFSPLEKCSMKICQGKNRTGRNITLSNGNKYKLKTNPKIEAPYFLSTKQKIPVPMTQNTLQHCFVRFLIAH